MGIDVLPVQLPALIFATYHLLFLQNSVIYKERSKEFKDRKSDRDRKKIKNNGQFSE
jgi:hypothetical protein